MQQNLGLTLSKNEFKFQSCYMVLNFQISTYHSFWPIETFMWDGAQCVHFCSPSFSQELIRQK